MAKILIIGGGAAGMAAAVFLGEKNHQVHLFEKNEKLGKTVYYRKRTLQYYQYL